MKDCPKLLKANNIGIVCVMQRKDGDFLAESKGYPGIVDMISSYSVISSNKLRHDLYVFPWEAIEMADEV